MTARFAGGRASDTRALNRTARARGWRKWLVAIALAALAGSALAAMGGGGTPFWMYASGLRVAL